MEDLAAVAAMIRIDKKSCRVQGNASRVIALKEKGKCSIQVELTITFKDEKVVVWKGREVMIGKWRKREIREETTQRKRAGDVIK